MKKISRIIILIIALSAIAFLFRTPLTQVFVSLEKKYIPCSQPITYSIGSFDKKFGISEEEFLNIVTIAKKTWEQSLNKKLFAYAQNGNSDLKINLIYDVRQEASQKLKDIGITVSETKASYNDLRSRYDANMADYTKLKTEFESRVIPFKNRQNAYEKEVTYLNKNGGASEADYNHLNKEKIYLDSEFSEINKLQTELDLKAGDVNALAIVLNRLVSSLNIAVKKFNTIGSELGGEFEEGTYNEGPNVREINIYQFNDEGKLARILTHELGHALGLQHSDNPKAVMYRLNNGVNEKLAVEDIVALRKRCDLFAQ